MIRHIFLGKARAEATPEQLEELCAAWRSLVGQVPGLRSLVAGRNISPRDQQYTVALVADLDDMGAWERYMQHPAHVAISQRLTSKLIHRDGRAMVQLVMEDQ
ncbi:hypothetical protein KTAU_29280 [Thermogemmatispora aurantia]|uniref:Dabb family protein n=1 Tax=Thermogemmatispora aurantia TaxID=2045279 RepID=UPI00124F24DE|nr:Dabb family protein [Thermogemmatispora aurantia]GER84292.1 hypothetical protein KTAU_29280 [Thermogemmatispora aurantia]